LGAGPAGLALADGLRDVPGVQTTLIEFHPRPGGLAQTVTWEGRGDHDLGPHKLFTTDKALEKRVHDLLPAGAWLTRPKKSRIFMGGRYLPYPPSPFSLVGIYGVPAFLKMSTDFAVAKVKGVFNGRTAHRTFEDDLSHRVGKSLYRVLFKPIAEKLWGDPSQLDSKLSEGRVQTPSLGQLVLKSLGVAKATESTEALSFFYPKGGLGKMWNAIVGKLAGAEVLLNHQVTGLVAEGMRVVAIRAKNRATEAERAFPIGPEDVVLSSLPLPALPSLLTPFESSVKRRIAGSVVLNDLLLVFLKVKQEKLFEDSWIFVPDPAVPFHRVSEQASFDPGMTPGGSIVCCEIMSHAGRPFFDKPDEELRGLCLEGLKRLGADTSGVLDFRVFRLPKSYPVYRPGAMDTVDEVLSRLDNYENFRTIGRQGSFNYIGSLDAMDIGYGAARWVQGGVTGPDARARWAAERKRTSHYPVLD